MFKSKEQLDALEEFGQVGRQNLRNALVAVILQKAGIGVKDPSQQELRLLNKMRIPRGVNKKEHIQGLLKKMESLCFDGDALKPEAIGFLKETGRGKRIVENYTEDNKPKAPSTPEKKEEKLSREEENKVLAMLAWQITGYNSWLNKQGGKSKKNIAWEKLLRRYSSLKTANEAVNWVRGEYLESPNDDNVPNEHFRLNEKGRTLIEKAEAAGFLKKTGMSKLDVSLFDPIAEAQPLPEPPDKAMALALLTIPLLTPYRHEQNGYYKVLKHHCKGTPFDPERLREMAADRYLRRVEEDGRPMLILTEEALELLEETGFAHLAKPRKKEMENHLEALSLQAQMLGDYGDDDEKTQLLGDLEHELQAYKGQEAAMAKEHATAYLSNARKHIDHGKADLHAQKVMKADGYKLRSEHKQPKPKKQKKSKNKK